MAKIKIYSTPSCAYCKLLEQYLDEKKVEYEDIDVSQDQAAGKEMVEKSGQMGVPVSIITTNDGKEEVVVGFDKVKINELLGLSG